MSELNAALGLVQLAHVRERNARRAAHVARYRQQLESLPVVVPFKQFRGESAYHLMPVLLPEGTDRLQVMTGMRERGVQTSIHYRPVDTFSAYVEAGLGPSIDVPLSHRIGDGVITLPLYPSMLEEQVDHVCQALATALSEQRTTTA